MRLVVENLTGALFFIQISDNATVAELRRDIEAQQKLPRDRLILLLDVDSYTRRPITDDGGDGSQTLIVDHGVKDGSHIYLFFKPLDDGSTHGYVFPEPDYVAPLFARRYFDCDTKDKIKYSL